MPAAVRASGFRCLRRPPTRQCPRRRLLLDGFRLGGHICGRAATDGATRGAALRRAAQSCVGIVALLAKRGRDSIQRARRGRGRTNASNPDRLRCSAGRGPLCGDGRGDDSLVVTLCTCRAVSWGPCPAREGRKAGAGGRKHRGSSECTALPAELQVWHGHGGLSGRGRPEPEQLVCF